jgi:hypothetical protein
MECPPDGDVAEWLRRGLQNLLPRFNSGRRLHLQYQRLNAGCGASRGATGMAATGRGALATLSLIFLLGRCSKIAEAGMRGRGLINAALRVGLSTATVRDLGTVARM